MGVPWVSLVAMTFAVTTMVVALAMFFLVLWQAPRRRSNQLAALYMAEVVCWSAMSLLLRTSGLIRADGTAFFYGIVLGIGFNGLCLYMLASHYAGLWKHWWAPAAAAAGLVYYLLMLPGVFNGSLYALNAITPQGDLRFTFTLPGYISFGIAYIFYMLSVGILWRHRSGPAGRLLVGSIVITVGVLTSIHPTLSQYSIPIMTAGVATALFAHAILAENLFNPLVLLNRDLTEANQRLSGLTAELKAANDQLREANRLKSNFLASMSHELRTPLNSILGYSEMLIQGVYGPLNETQLDRVEIVLRNGRNLLQLISDILDLSRIEAGQLELKVHPLEIGPVIEECFTLFGSVAARKGLSLSHDMSALSKPVLADRGRVLQVIVNLVSNAIKFTPSGRVTVTVGDVDGAIPDAPVHPDDGWVQLTVEDTGVGIKPEDLPIIFDEFRQADESMTREYEGSGLGLAICRLLVEMMDGRIWVESQPGVGSRFHVALPAASREEGKSAEPAEIVKPMESLE